MSNPEFIMIGGQAFKPVTIQATGEWQLFHMKNHKSYILVHPNGRQAWFHEEDMTRAALKLGTRFRYTNDPFKDLRRLAGQGLRPFHVDADFDPTGIAAPLQIN